MIDYGESSYIGYIGLDSDQPLSSPQWTDGFDHTGESGLSSKPSRKEGLSPTMARFVRSLAAWTTLAGYYIKAYKSGIYPTIVADKIWMWARPHGAADWAPDPWCGEPSNTAWVRLDRRVTVTKRNILT